MRAVKSVCMCRGSFSAVTVLLLSLQHAQEVALAVVGSVGYQEPKLTLSNTTDDKLVLSSYTMIH